MDPKLDLEHRIERVLLAARWLMAPIYLGLAVAVAVLGVVFVRELVLYAPSILTASTERTILATLVLIDLALTGNLLLLVIYSGYESFVSKLVFHKKEDRPSWMDFVDFSSVKLNLLASVVAISAIYLLRWFMEIGDLGPDETFNDVRLRWLIAIHLTFVVSGVLTALMEWLGAKAGKH